LLPSAWSQPVTSAFDSAMIAVTATEVGVRQIMGPGLQKKPHRTRARNFLGLVGNLDEKSGHGHPLGKV
jgi:hypothetical protein